MKINGILCDIGTYAAIKGIDKNIVARCLMIARVKEAQSQ